MTKRGRKLKAGPQQQHPKTSPTAHPLLASGHVRRRLPHVQVWPCQLPPSCSSKQAQALPPGWTVAYLIDTPKPIERASLAYAGQPGERDSPRLASSPNCCCPASLASSHDAERVTLQAPEHKQPLQMLKLFVAQTADRLDGCHQLISVAMQISSVEISL